MAVECGSLKGLDMWRGMLGGSLMKGRREVMLRVRVEREIGMAMTPRSGGLRLRCSGPGDRNGECYVRWVRLGWVRGHAVRVERERMVLRPIATEEAHTPWKRVSISPVNVH